MGDTWYDSPQVRFNKRFSHGLTAQVAYTWQKELTNGVNSNTSYLTPDAPAHQRSVQIPPPRRRTGNPGGTLSGGYGYVNWLQGAGAQPRSGQLIARFTF
jgi:hypothetical protein